MEKVIKLMMLTEENAGINEYVQSDVILKMDEMMTEAAKHGQSSVDITLSLSEIEGINVLVEPKITDLVNASVKLKQYYEGEGLTVRIYANEVYSVFCFSWGVDDDRSAIYRILRPSVSDRESILRLYRLQIGRKYCIWNDNYPGISEIDADMERKDLYIMKDEADAIIAAISLGMDQDVENMECWSEGLQPSRELARLAVAPGYQGQGIATHMIEFVSRKLLAHGTSGVHMMISDNNTSALKAFSKFGFSKINEFDRDGLHILCFEKKL